MTPGFAWALVVVLHANTSSAPLPPPPQWFATREECEAYAAARTFHFETTNRPVAWVGCQRVRLVTTR